MTWKGLPQAPIAGRPVFATEEEGWISGNSGGGGMYGTRDGGRTWHGNGPALDDLPASLPTGRWYENAHFADGKHGSVVIRLQPSADSETRKGAALVLYKTDNAGLTWSLSRTLIDATSRIAANTVTFDARSESWILLAAYHDPKGITLESFTHPGTIVAQEGPSMASKHSPWHPGDGVASLSFNDGVRGWAVTDSGELLSTTDAGTTWEDISPVKRASSAPPTAPPKGQSRAGSDPLILSLRYDQSLGFDRNNVLSSSEMQTWYNSSPFYDIGIYIGGSNYCGAWNSGHTKCLSRTDPGLTTTWLAQAQTQGWGFLPIWVGPQAPCVNQTGLGEFTPVNAAGQGKSNATSASAAMAALGLSGTVVFYNMENYTSTPGDACSLAVRAFLNAWVSGMNANGFQTTAVYGNPGPAQNDFSQVAGLTQVWVASYGRNNITAPNVTIWGISPLCDPFSNPPCTPALWSNHQRIRQYLGGQTVMFGDANPFSIDFDIVDAQIVGSTEAARPDDTYAYNVVSIGLGGTTTLGGINDEGVVVGSAQVQTTGNGCGVIGWCGFIYSGSYMWTQYTDQGTPVPTQFNGSNNLGIVVGSSENSSGYSIGVTYNTGTFSVLDYPNADNTTLLGINDDGQIVGEWWDNPVEGPAPGGYFLYSAGLFSTLPNYPGAVDTYYSSINGDGQLAARYYDGTNIYSFVYNAATGTFSSVPSYPGSTYTGLTSNMSNNGQAGGVADLSGGSEIFFVYDENAGSFTLLPSTITEPPSGLNDGGQLIGGLDSNAYLATPE